MSLRLKPRQTPVERPTPPPGSGNTPRAALATVLCAVLVTVGAYAFAQLKGRSFGDLSRDPAAVLNGVFYTGYYSNLVILAWSAAAVSAALGGLVLYRAGDRPTARCLLAGAALSTAMLMDDFFLLHEEVYPKIGIPENAVYLAYAAGMAVFAVRHRHRLGSGMPLVGLTLFCWSFSVLLDLTLHMAAPFVVEDGIKATGVALWSLLMVRYSAGELLRAIRGARPAEAPGLGTH